MRTRGRFVWGLPNLMGAAKQRVAEANVLAVGAVPCVDTVSRASGVGLLEHPEDPACDPYPSLFSTDLLLGASARIGASFASLDQGAFGAPVPKPTTLWGTVDDLAAHDGIRDKRDPAHFLKERRDSAGGFMSRWLAQYPSDFCRLIARTFVFFSQDEP